MYEDHERIVRSMLDFARERHDYPDLSGRPYWHHVHRVHDIAVTLLSVIPDHVLDATGRLRTRLTATGHDLIEEHGKTCVDEDVLRARVPDEVVVRSVTRLSSRPDGVTYMQNSRDLAASRDLVLIVSKLADNHDNGREDRIAELPPEMRGISGRYRRSIRILSEGYERVVGRPPPTVVPGPLDAPEHAYATSRTP